MCTATTFCHLYLKLKQDYVTYRAIADWLGDYSYKLPETQVNQPDLNVALLYYFHGDIHKAFAVSTITKHFTPTEQKQITKWIYDLNNYPILPH